MRQRDNTFYRTLYCCCRRRYSCRSGKDANWLGRPYLYFFLIGNGQIFCLFQPFCLDYTRLVDDEPTGKRSDCFCGTSGSDLYTRLHISTPFVQKVSVSIPKFFAWSLITRLPMSSDAGTRRHFCSPLNGVRFYNATIRLDQGQRPERLGGDCITKRGTDFEAAVSCLQDDDQ